MSTRTALTVVGGVVGSYFGYPQLGLVVGGLIGGIVDPTVIPGPKIGEIAVQTSADGVPRPVIYGTMACYGNIIQTGPAVKVEGEDGGGKGEPEQGTGDQVFRTYAIRICEGSIAGVLRVWQDNKLVYDARVGSPIPDDSEKWISNKTIYLGDEAQLPNPALVVLNADSPSYRGTAYIVFDTEDLTARAGSIPQYRFEVASSVLPPVVQSITNSADIPVYEVSNNPEFAFVFLNYLAPPNSNEGINAAVGTILVNAVPMDESQPYKVLEIDEACSTVGTTDIYLDSASFGSASPVPSDALSPRGSYGANVIYMGTSYPTKSILYLTAGGSLVSVLVPNGGSAINWARDNTAENKFIGRYLWMTESHIYLGIRQLDSINHNVIYCWPTTAGSAPDYRVNAIASISGVSSVASAHFFTHFGRDGKFRTINDVGSYKVYSSTLVLESSETLPFSTSGLSSFGVDGDLIVYALEPTNQLIVRKVSDWSVQSTYTNSIIGTKDQNCRVIFTDESVFMQFNETILRSEYSTGLVGEPAILSDIISDIHDRCGIESTMFDVSELTDSVDGFMLAGEYTGADAIGSPKLVYFYDKSEHDKALYYPKRGAAVIETLTVDDLTEIPDTTQREQAIEIPKKLHLRYQHANSGYPPVKATVVSSSPDILTTGEVSIEVPIVLDEDEAVQTADKMYKVTRAELYGTTDITVPLYVGAKYVTGNCIGLSLRGSTKRVRIEEITLTPDWQIKLSLKPDRQSAYTSNLTGVPIPEPTPPPSTIIGATELAILDISARSDSEDDLNYLVAVSGRLAPWYGARYQRSFDGGATWTTVQDIATASIMGELLDDVADASEHFTDTTNSVNVSLYRSGQTLSSITEEQFLSEGNGFALEKADGSWEIMQFMDAVENSDGSYTLTTLHRGQLNSGTSSHAAGARFVMLQRPTHIPAQASWIGQSITHRAISLGESADDTINDVTLTYEGRSQIEWPVASLELTRDGNDVSATWEPRHRFGSGNSPISSVNFQGFRVTIDGGSQGGVTFDTTDKFFTDYDASALGTPVEVSVSSLNRITGAGPSTSDSV